MTTYNEACRQILENIEVMETEKKSILKSMGQVLAEEFCSSYDLPQSNCARPDGYAARSEDIAKASKEHPVVLRIVETVRAGCLPKNSIQSGTCARIMTGSVLPEGADCVVKFEDTDEPADKNGPNKKNPSKVKVYLAVAPGDNIRKAGSNVRKGSIIVPKGTIIGPSQVSVLAANGISNVKVVRRPVIAVIATGDELIGAGRLLSDGKTYDCNRAALASLISHYGGIPRVMGIVRDNEMSITARIKSALTADAIITSGGVSKGDYDLVRLVLGKMGKQLFSRIDMGPGASCSFGLINRVTSSKEVSIPVFALAGPPSGCIINFETLVRPALLKMLGYTKTQHPLVEAIAMDALPDRKPMAFLKWSNLQKINDTYYVKLNLSEMIGPLAAMAIANSLSIVPEQSAILVGDTIQVMPLDWRRDGNYF